MRSFLPVLAAALVPGLALAAPVEQSRDVPTFDRIELHGSIDAEIDVDAGEQSVVIRADADLQDRIRTEVRGRTLVIDMKGSFRNVGAMKALIRVAALEALDIDGSSDARIRGIDSPRFDIEIDGSGDVEAAGRAATCHFEIDGSGDISARDLGCGDAEVDISGSGDAEIHVTGSLSIDIAGSGDVDAWGSPSTRRVTTSGSGDFRVHDDRPHRD